MMYTQCICSQDHSIGEQEETGINETFGVLMFLAIDSGLSSAVTTSPTTENTASQDGDD